MGVCSTHFESFCTERDTDESNQPEEGLIRKRNTRKDSSELRSFHDAIANGDGSMVVRMIKQNKNLIDNKYNEASPLTCAVTNKQHKILKFLLKQDAFVNVKDGESGDTPLHAAVRHADLKAVRTLCQYKADQTIENECDETPMLIAMEQDTNEIAVYLQSLLNANGATLTTTGIGIPHIKPNEAMDYCALIRDTSIASVSAVDEVDVNDMAENLLVQLNEECSLREQTLKPLEGWLERKQHSPPYSWLKRWVVVRSPYLFWSERHMNVIVERVDAKERKRWNKCIHLKKIRMVEAISGNKNRKFKMVAGEKEYIFRANNKKTRDYWIENLNETIEWFQQQALAGGGKRDSHRGSVVTSKAVRLLTS